MVNIEKITSTLAKLPDESLQRYAMMHKDDPYIVALAVSESNRRKDMRAASQAQPMQQQPKVVDQAVAEMAAQQMPAMPEEQGIGALPVQMDFAEGGITGYASGGEVERYSGESGSFTGVPYADVPAGIAAIGVPAAIYQQASSLATRLGTSVSSVLARMGYDVAKAGASGLAGSAKLGVSGPGQAILAGGVPATQFATDVMAANPKLREAYSDNPMMGAMDPSGALAAAILDQAASGPEKKITQPLQDRSPAPTAAQGSTTYKPEDTSGMDRRLATPGATLPMAANITKKEGGGGGNRGTGGAGGAGGAGAGVSRATAPSSQSIEDRFLAAQKRLTDQANPYQAQEDALAAEQKKFAEDKYAATIERNEKFKDAFKGREGRIEERAKELEKSKDTNTGLAFLEAGLAIMATPGGLATAIGKGAREGTAKYAAGIEKLRSAKDKLDEARDRMEELKLNRDEMSAKEEMEAKLGIQQTVISGKKDALASAKTLFGERSALSQAIVKETLNAEEKAKDRATQVQTAGAAAAIALGPQNKFIQDWMSKPENKGKSYSDAYAAFRNLGAASERNDITGLKAVQAGLIKEISENLTMTKAEKAAKQAQINEINNRILALTGAAAPSTTGGAQRTIDWNSIK
jgi:hypothetical protein